jgi:hypothetical protein
MSAQMLIWVFVGLHKHFGVISHQRPLFPDWLGPLYFENTSLVGNPFLVVRNPREPCPTDHRIANHKIKVGYLEKQVLEVKMRSDLSRD